MKIIKKTSVPMTRDGFTFNPKQMFKQEIGFYVTQFSIIFESNINGPLLFIELYKVLNEIRVLIFFSNA